MTISLNGFRPTDLNSLNQVNQLESLQKAADTTGTAPVSTTNVNLVRDSLDISLKAAINTMLASNPLVNSLSNEERAQLINSVEFSLKQGLGISSLLRIIQK